jgi:hypothetical protein
VRKDDTHAVEMGISVPRRVDAGRLLTVAISVISSAFIAAGAWFGLQYRVDDESTRQTAVERRVKELEDARDAGQRNAHELELKSATAIAVTAEQLQEISRRLSSLESKIDRLTSQRSTSAITTISNPIEKGEQVMNPPVVVTLPDIVRRARSVIGHGSYGLGRGGRVPHNPTPFDADGYCDCSGFVAWSCGVDRYQPQLRGEYVETTNIVRDAFHTARLFMHAAVGVPGYIIVYPDREIPNPAKPREMITVQGHVGIVSAVDTRGRVTKVIHCSSGNEKHRGYAIAETEPTVFFDHAAVLVKFRNAIAAPVHAQSVN